MATRPVVIESSGLHAALQLPGLSALGVCMDAFTPSSSSPSVTRRCHLPAAGVVWRQEVPVPDQISRRSRGVTLPRLEAVALTHHTHPGIGVASRAELLGLTVPEVEEMSAILEAAGCLRLGRLTYSGVEYCQRSGATSGEGVSSLRPDDDPMEVPRAKRVPVSISPRCWAYIVATIASPRAAAHIMGLSAADEAAIRRELVEAGVVWL